MSLYDDPIFKMTVEGTDDAGNKASQDFRIIRFGIKYGLTDIAPHVVGLTSGSFKVTWDPNYITHSFEGEDKGGWRLKGKESFLIHAGADPAEGGKDFFSASNGCFEVLGVHGFSQFNNYLISISGSSKSTVREKMVDISNANIITLIVKPAKTPPLKVARAGPFYKSH